MRGFELRCVGAAAGEDRRSASGPEVDGFLGIAEGGEAVGHSGGETVAAAIRVDDWTRNRRRAETVPRAAVDRDAAAVGAAREDCQMWDGFEVAGLVALVAIFVAA